MQTIHGRRISPRERCEEAFQAAWEELVRRYDFKLRGQVCRSLRNAGFPLDPEQIQERVQEVYFRLLQGGTGRLRLLRRWSEPQVVSYLSRVAQRVVVDEVRARAAAKRGGPRIAECLIRLAEGAADPGGNPEEDAINAEGRRLLLERCRLLAESMTWRKDRGLCLRVLRLALLEGWSSREIACSEGGRLVASSVDTLVYRARRWLAKGGLEVPSRRGKTGRLLSSPP